MSLLSPLVEDIPEDKLGLFGGITWNPVVNVVDIDKLGEASPTTEYSSNEGSE